MTRLAKVTATRRAPHATMETSAAAMMGNLGAAQRGGGGHSGHAGHAPSLQDSIRKPRSAEVVNASLNRMYRGLVIPSLRSSSVATAGSASSLVRHALLRVAVHADALQEAPEQREERHTTRRREKRR